MDFDPYAFCRVGFAKGNIKTPYSFFHAEFEVREEIFRLIGLGGDSEDTTAASIPHHLNPANAIRLLLKQLDDFVDGNVPLGWNSTKARKVEGIFPVHPHRGAGRKWR